MRRVTRLVLAVCGLLAISYATLPFAHAQTFTPTVSAAITYHDVQCAATDPQPDHLKFFATTQADTATKVTGFTATPDGSGGLNIVAPAPGAYIGHFLLADASDNPLPADCSPDITLSFTASQAMATFHVIQSVTVTGGAGTAVTTP